MAKKPKKTKRPAANVPLRRPPAWLAGGLAQVTKGKKLPTERRRRLVARCMAEGCTVPADIAEWFGLPHETAKGDVEAVRAIWRTEVSGSYQDLVATQQARLAWVFSEAAEAWHQSRRSSGREDERIEEA